MENNLSEFYTTAQLIELKKNIENEIKKRVEIYCQKNNFHFTHVLQKKDSFVLISKAAILNVKFSEL